VALATAACSSGSTATPRATGPVDVPAPTATATDIAATCTALLASLPDQLDPGVDRRPVTGDSARTAAWGDPAITLQCGVEPADQNQTPLVLDDLAFVTQRRPGRVLWSTRDLAVTIRLDIPRSYESQADVVLPLVPALKTLPTRRPGRP